MLSRCVPCQSVIVFVLFMPQYTAHTMPNVSTPKMAAITDTVPKMAPATFCTLNKGPGCKIAFLLAFFGYAERSKEVCRKWHTDFANSLISGLPNLARWVQGRWV